MKRAHVELMRAPVPPPVMGQVRNLIDLWLGQVASSSRRTYKVALTSFAEHLARAPEQAVLALLQSRRNGQALALGYRAWLLERKMAPATINNRLTALRSLVQHAAQLELVDWTLGVQGVRAETYRDTRGPGVLGIRRMLQLAGEGDDPRKGRRDQAILWLLFTMGLRRGEVSSLDLVHVQRQDGALYLRVRGKGARGETERVPLTVPPPAAEALEAWLLHRGDDPGPLFVGCRFHREENQRLSPNGIRRMVADLGAAAQLGRVSPHGLRHTGVTRALELSRGDLRRVQRFSRHKDPKTIMKYDDNRTDSGGAIAQDLARDMADQPGNDDQPGGKD